MPAVYEHLHVVTDREVDELGHANNVEYLKWMQQAAVAHSTAQGWPPEAYRELGSGWVVRSHEITYLRPALPGQDLVIRTWVANMRRATSLRRFRILGRSDQTLLAQASTTWVFVEYARGSPVRIPVRVAQSFEIMGDDFVA